MTMVAVLSAGLGSTPSALTVTVPVALRMARSMRTSSVSVWTAPGYARDDTGRMSLSAVVVDPLVEAVPPAWDEFVARERVAPLWRSDLLRIADRCAQAPSSMVLVEEAGEPVALFHARHVRPANPRRFASPYPLTGLHSVLGFTECRTFPRAAGAGMVFAVSAGTADRAAAVRVFERAIGRRRGAVLAYRDLDAAHLRLVPSACRVRLGLSPSMVLHNEWSDFDAYLAALSPKWRGELKKVRRTVAAGRAVQLEPGEAVDPARASWLVDLVLRRHLSRAVPRPPVPVGYFAALAGLPGVRFMTYRSDEDRVLAFLAWYDSGTELLPVFWGSTGEANLYFDQYSRLVELMIRTGRERLVMGKGLEKLKTRYLARPEARWGVVGLR
jgi:hypothetical protein